MKLSHSFLALVLALPISAQADEIPATSPAPIEAPANAQTPPAVVNQIKSFDTRLTELPARYSGADFTTLFDAVSKNLAPKDEFETTQAYQQRVNKALTQPLMEQLTGDALFAIGFKWSEESIKYNADTQTLKFRELLDSSKFLDLFGDRGFRFGGAKVEVLGTYIGKTAQGAEREVSKVRRDYQHLAFKNLKDFSFKSDMPGIAGVLPPTDFGFDLKLDPVKAKEAKSNLYKLVIFKLAEPYAVTDSRPLAPTLNSPEEGTSYQHSLYGNVVEIWFYNFETDEIYAKLRPNNRRYGKRHVPTQA